MWGHSVILDDLMRGLDFFYFVYYYMHNRQKGYILYIIHKFMNILLRKIIETQKNILEKSISKKYVPRTVFNNAKRLMETDLIKVIIGPRRAGKSILSLLLLEGKKFAYLNFDEDSLAQVLKDIKDYDILLEELFTVYGKTSNLFFDEIQNLDRWELFINRLHREGYNVILTGSNSKLLSKELATHLTGRHFEIKVFPFDFKEYLNAKEFEIKNESILLKEYKGELFNHLENYIINGGYPEIVTKELDNKEYLSTLFDSTILKDIIGRYKIRFPQKINTVSSIIINNIGNEMSYRKLMIPLDVKSSMTVEKYAKLIEESYTIFLLEKYSNKTKERFGLIKKPYTVDNGFISAKSVQFSNNKGKLMENLIFTELVKRGYKPNFDLFYYKTKNFKEVDFIVRDGINVTYLIQSAYDISESKTEKREINALIEASKELRCDNLLLITWDREEIKKIDGKEIQYIPLWKWLLHGNN